MMGGRTLRHYRALGRAPWPRLAVALLMLSAAVGAPTGAWASARIAAPPVALPIEEERPAEEDRGQEPSNPLPGERCRSPRPLPPTVERIAQANARVPSRRATLAPPRGCPKGLQVEARLPIPPSFAYWVRSQTW